ncbi:AraC-like DNA-binding protein [Endobacter medicaginis]|uniref:AraC-like DNA-binding protein n=2 Tax=Endobacter medicaginis TaxID=1181271 RepID=A0A839USK3_9PROT|nr:helix-turn-helix transcriptional regulator [Endobacter medicaginis]MBB3173238.1 AraC-like DNA-binding protein [Endobacter medicaginis]MCX5476473.1 helix-turn-helix transcriptional regulator [Endobacter medicaginis]
MAKPRPVPNPVGRRLHPAGVRIDRHAHDRAQLTLVLSGISRISDGQGWWLAARDRAIWVPPGLAHEARYSETSEIVVLELDDIAELSAVGCCCIDTTALIRELACAGLEADAATRRLSLQLLGHLLSRQTPDLHAAIRHGSDPRLVRATALLVAEPGREVGLAALAAMAGTSARTLNRLFVDQTGLSFGRWRARLRVLVAIERLAEGESVTSIAFDLGYGGPAAFTTMFTRATGLSPARYLAERLRPAASQATSPAMASAVAASDAKPPRSDVAAITAETSGGPSRKPP